ncbi:hypothetical protein NLG97_g8558 [Lecanicillium saksenae]|uniref:Uncharacterized protein n=1 Tax=Lecanicillium saksenae TaxID=468837 RepID=A0ACC1QJS1_9HYPO|nr:hypothetical protein NLG97_g8558 [Lecanicillium saksenae]
MRHALISSLLVASAYSHGVILKTIGANGVTAPGACVLDGTPRNCIVNSCGAQADTAIVRDFEINSGKYGPLGWTQGGGECKADAVISAWMGVGPVPRYSKGRQSTGQEDPKPSGGFPLLDLISFGCKRRLYDHETIISDNEGKGKDSGLPTTNDQGEISFVYRVVNEDGGGPLTVALDTWSAGTDKAAFVNAKKEEQARITKNVFGIPFVGLTTATGSECTITIKMPEGAVCKGEVAGLNNVCFARFRNMGQAGPFGGAGFFTQSSESRKRAIAYRLKKRMDIEGLEN